MQGSIALDTVIRSIQTRRRAELDLLANFAASPRLAGVILAEMDADLSWFADEDTRAICLAVDRAAKSEKTMPVETIAFFARDLLKRLGLWVNDDVRPFVTGSHLWGPGPLSAILTLMPFDPEETRRVCRRLTRVKTWMESQSCQK